MKRGCGLTVEIQRAPQTIRPRNVNVVTKRRPRRRNVRQRGTHVAGARRLKARLQLLRGQPVQFSDELEQ
jgi:hypothetical protein